MKIKNIKIEIDEKDVEHLIEALEYFWDNEILGKDVDYENDKNAREISNLTHTFYKIVELFRKEEDENDNN